MSIHGIGEKKVRILREKVDPKDLRGTHLSQPHRITEEVKQKVSIVAGVFLGFVGRSLDLCFQIHNKPVFTNSMHRNTIQLGNNNQSYSILEEPRFSSEKRICLIKTQHLCR